LRNTAVYHTHKCRPVENSREVNRREVPIHAVRDKRLCGHCYDDLVREQQQEPNPSRQRHHGGTLDENNFFPDCAKCGAAGYVHVIRATKKTGNDTIRGDWQCLKCNKEFDVEPPSPWHNVNRLADDEQVAHIHLNIREADPREVASAHNITADRLSDLATKAKRRLAGWRVAAAAGD
jgi:hypothetical protein